MPLTGRWTLTRYLIEERRRYPQASGELNALILDISLACKAIARIVAMGQLGAGANAAAGGAVNVQGEVQKPLDTLSNDIFLRMNEWSGHLAGMASEEMEHPQQIPPAYARGKYLLVFDPLDGSNNIDVNVAVGSIFSVLRAPPDVAETGRDVVEADFLQPGATQVAAGYALYGPATMLVLSVGNGVAAFTLDPNLGEFVLTHRSIRVPEDTQEFAINTSNARFWEPPVKRYVDECLAGRTGPRGKDFNMRWIASLVAEAHRILMRGGLFMYPRDNRASPQAGVAPATPRGWTGLGTARWRRSTPTWPPAADVRGQPDRLPHRTGRRPREHRAAADSGRQARRAAPAHRAGVRQREGSVAGGALPPRTRAVRGVCAAVLAAQPVQGLSHVDPASDHRHHRLQRCRHQQRDAHLRGHLQARRRQGGRRRRRQLPPL